VNEYLKEITSKDITAKDFRTWAGTVLAAMALNELEIFDSAAQAKRNLRAAVEKVSGRLGNTPTICRKCYLHPEVLNSYLDDNLVLELKSNIDGSFPVLAKIGFAATQLRLDKLQHGDGLACRASQFFLSPMSLSTRPRSRERKAYYAAFACCPFVDELRTEAWRDRFPPSEG
jgi:hypothetical protein